MMAFMAIRRRRQREQDRASQSGTSDQEGERVGGVRRKKRRRDCSHDPWARELAKVIMGVYYWMTEPTMIKRSLGNGLGWWHLRCKG